MNVNRLKLQLRQHEGRRLTVYDDATGKPLRQGMKIEGKPTIGYGRNLTDRGISMEEAEFLLDNDVRDAANGLRATFSWFVLMNDVRQEVLVNMVVNVGLGGLRTFKRMIRALETEDYETAAREMKDSTYARQVGKRADVLAEQLRRGTPYLEWEV